MVRLAALALLVAASAFQLPRPRSFPLVPRAAAASSSTTSLEALLARLKDYAPVRCILVQPGGAAILETASDASTWTFAESTMPSGKTLLTAKTPDASFEVHIDVDRAVRATVGRSAKTGGPIVRILDGDGAALLTLLPSGSCADDAIADDLGEDLTLVRAAA